MTEIGVLSPDELAAFTGKSQRAQKRYDSQAQVLRALGIPFIPRPDKTLIVYREHVHATRQATQERIDAPAVLL